MWNASTACRKKRTRVVEQVRPPKFEWSRFPWKYPRRGETLVQFIERVVMAGYRITKTMPPQWFDYREKAVTEEKTPHTTVFLRDHAAPEMKALDIKRDRKSVV